MRLELKSFVADEISSVTKLVATACDVSAKGPKLYVSSLLLCYMEQLNGQIPQSQCDGFTKFGPR